MDPDTTTAVMARHHPRRFLAAIGIKRCVRCRRRWPCGHWLYAADLHRRHDDEAAIARTVDMFVQQPNRGHWGR